MKAPRYGRFTVPTSWVLDYRSELLRIMGKCAIYRAEHLLASDQVEYYAACDKFRVVPAGECVPTYVWFFSDDGGFWCEEVGANAQIQTPPEGGRLE